MSTKAELQIEVDRLHAILGGIEAKRINRHNYRRETMPLCPRCGTPEYGLPFCTDVGFSCSETCQIYRWDSDVCTSCAVETDTEGRTE